MFTKLPTSCQQEVAGSDYDATFFQIDFFSNTYFQSIIIEKIKTYHIEVLLEMITNYISFSLYILILFSFIYTRFEKLFLLLPHFLLIISVIYEVSLNSLKYLILLTPKPISLRIIRFNKQKHKSSSVFSLLFMQKMILFMMFSRFYPLARIGRQLLLQKHSQVSKVYCIVRKNIEQNEQNIDIYQNINFIRFDRSFIK